MDDDDIREQLLQVKKAHSAVLRENGQYKTKLRIAERERNRREEELNRFFTVPPQQQTKINNNNNIKLSPSILAENRIEMMALRRKVLLYERLLKEKTKENAKLLEDKKVVEAAETRKLTERLENECQRLRVHLAQSVPETEFLKEKDSYLTIINRLIDENMHLRQVVGKFEQRRKESEKLLSELGGGEALVNQFRTMSINSRKQANFYKKSLTNLMSKGSVQSTKTSNHRRPTLASTSSSLSGKLLLKNKNLNENFLNGNILRKDISPKNDLKRRASSLESSKASQFLKNEQTLLKSLENEIMEISMEGVKVSSINNTPKSNNSSSLATCFIKRSQRSISNTSKVGLAEEEKKEEEEDNNNDFEENLLKKGKEDKSENEGEDDKIFQESVEEEEEIDEEEEEAFHLTEESDEKEIEEDMVGEGKMRKPI